MNSNNENRMIGMIIPTTDNSFFSSLAHNVEVSLNEKGYSLLLCDAHNDVTREKQYLNTLSSLCSGIIDVSGLSELSDDLVPEDYPLVFVDRRPNSNRVIPWVGNDDEKAQYTASDCYGRMCFRLAGLAISEAVFLSCKPH